MKRNLYKSMLGLLLCCVMVSCKKSFLDVVPKGQLVPTTTNDYSLIMNYPAFYFFTPSGGWQTQVQMGDEVAAEATYFNPAKAISQNAFKWADVIYQSTDVDQVMPQWLTDLYSINKVINEVQNSTDGTAQQKTAVYAEALASRAWLYFQFINFYGKPYVAGTAASDLGFPIIKTADITATGFTRNSVQEVYDFIISDFNTAIAGLPLQNPIGPTRFNKAAAEGMLGKVYLYMGKNAEALTLFNAAFTDNAAESTPARLYNYNVEFATGGKFLPITTSGPTNSPGLNYNDVTESILAKTFDNGNNLANNFNSNYLVLTPQAAALFSPSDLRLKFYKAQFANFVVNPSGRLSKYAVKFSKCGLQISELYLLRAECKTRLNDLAGAEADVETLRNDRMPAASATVPAAIAGNQVALLSFIMDERTREFAMEGYRFFDMRRLSVDPLFTTPTYTHILYNDATYTNTTLFTLQPARFTLKLPPFIMNANPQFTNNQ